jgi:hypothetical protein
MNHERAFTELGDDVLDRGGELTPPGGAPVPAWVRDGRSELEAPLATR